MTRHEELWIAGLGLAGVGALLLLAANSPGPSRQPAPVPAPGTPTPSGEPQAQPGGGKTCGRLGQVCGAGCDCCGLWYDQAQRCQIPPLSAQPISGPCNPYFTSATTADPSSPTHTLTSCCLPPNGPCYLTRL